MESAHTKAEEALSRRIADLEAALADPQVNTMENRVVSLEACYSDSDVEFNNRLTTLEGLRVTHLKDGSDNRVATLEKVTAELSSWRSEVDGVLDDVKIAVQKLGKSHDRMVFDEMPRCPSPLLTPTQATARSSAGLITKSP